jgi:glycosyltransferase involved in cell wall biosynthesis
LRILLIVPTLDSFQLLPRLVESLQAQTSGDWRVLFIDGPSGAEHRSWLERLCAGDHRFRWNAQDPTQPGIFGAMNQGFAEAGPTDWLLFWGSDDWAAAPDVFARVGQAVGSDQPDLIVCRGRYVSMAADPVGKPQLARASAFRWCGSYRRSLALGSTPPHQATLIGPGARARLARYAPGFQLSADLDYFLQLSRFKDLLITCLDLELVQMTVGGVSGLRHRRRLQEVRWAYRRVFGWRWPLPFLLRYMQRGLNLLEPRSPVGG